MLRLRTFGQAELRAADGTLLRTITSQPKLMALVTYVVAGRRAGAPRRDTLLAMFWPESETAAARHALSQALSAIRQEVGLEVLDGKRRETVELSATGLWCDAVAFREALKAGRLEDALALYGGPFLDGFFLPGASEFERWLEDERREVQRSAVQAALALAKAARDEARWVHARQWAERAITLDAYDESAWRELIRCLDAAGDRAGVLVAFRRLSQRFMDDLGVEPAPETVQLVESVRGRTTGSSELVPGLAQPPAPAAVQRPRVPPEQPARQRKSLALPVFLALLALGVVALATREPAPEAPRLDPKLVAILPFRSTGLDSSMAGLDRGGMVELLSLRLAAETELRAIDQRTLLFAWDQLRRTTGGNAPLDSALALAARLGAGRLLEGIVIGTPGRLTLTATLYRVPDGRVLGRGTVEDVPDRLAAMVDRLAAQVLSLAAGEDVSRVESLATTPLPALLEYLKARHAYLSGKYMDALRGFDRALELDSAFALAALGLMNAATWASGPYATAALRRADRLAWEHRERLNQRDRVRLLSLVGFRRPAPTPLAEHITFMERAVASAPDDPELWYQLGDQLLHWGALIAEPDWRARAEADFERSVQLDSTFYPPLLHLTHLAADRRDSVALRAYSQAYLRLIPEGIDAKVMRWLVAEASGDTTAEDRSGTLRLETLDELELAAVIRTSEFFTVGLEDAERASQILHARAASAVERSSAASWAMQLALARGRPEEARRAWRDWLRNERDPEARRSVLRNAVYARLSAYGSSEAASEAARELRDRLAWPAHPAVDRSTAADLCAVELWRLTRGDTLGTVMTIDGLQHARIAPEAVRPARETEVCAAVLHVLLAEARGQIRVEMLLRFDSTLVAQPFLGFSPMPVLRFANLVSARAWEARGDLMSALAALQRRGHILGGASNPPADLGRECRLAIRVRLKALAAESCDRFLTLMSDPEPSLRAEVERVRAQYARFVLEARQLPSR